MTRFFYALLIAGSVAHGQERNTRDARGHDSHRPCNCRRAKPTPLDEAIAAFRFPLITQPELVRVRLELAFFLREKDSAPAFRDRAGDIPPAFAANVRRFLRVIRARNHSEGRWASLGVSWALGWGFTLSGSATLRRTDFDGPQPPYTRADERREDETRTFRLSAYNRALTLWGFSPRLSIVRETRDSNAP